MNKKKINNWGKTILLLLFLIVNFQLTLADPLDDFVNNLDTSYYDGTINITSYSATMLDSNTNGINDTLQFLFSTDHNTPDNYTAVLFILNEPLGGFESPVEITSQNPSFDFNVSSDLLTNNTFTYQIKLYDSSDFLRFASNNLETFDFSAYEQNIVVDSISDQSINDELIQVNVTFNVTSSTLQNITVYLHFENSSISKKLEQSLSAPQTEVAFEFNNDTIFRTHYTGTYAIERISIGDRANQADYITGSYDFRDFTQGSYIDSILSSELDLDGDELIDTVQLNTTVQADTANTFTVSATLVGPNGEFVFYDEVSAAVSSGQNVISLEVPGSKIYQSGLDGVFTYSEINLFMGTNHIDRISSAATLPSESYVLFERPLLPDLTGEVTTLNNSGIREITVFVSNQGLADASFVPIKIIGPRNYTNQTVLSNISSGMNKSVVFTINNWVVSDKYIVAIDENNMLDESNKSNNILSSNKAPSIPSSIFPNGGEDLGEIINLKWSASTDINLDYPVYDLQYSNDSGLLWENIISNLGFTGTLSDGNAFTSIELNQTLTKTVYIRLHKNSTVLNASFTLRGESLE